MKKSVLVVGMLFCISLFVGGKESYADSLGNNGLEGAQINKIFEEPTYSDYIVKQQKNHQQVQ